MNKLLPIGSIVEYESEKLAIIGYTEVHTDNGYVTGYLIVPYPLGFMDKESIKLLPYDKVSGVVSEGYKNDSCEKALNTMEELHEFISNNTKDDVEALLKMLRKDGEQNE